MGEIELWGGPRDGERLKFRVPPTAVIEVTHTRHGDGDCKAKHGRYRYTLGARDGRAMYFYDGTAVTSG